MAFTTRLSAFLCLVVLFLHGALAADGYPSRSAECTYSCWGAIGSFTFAGKSTEADEQRCENKLFVNSTYLCTKKYCSSDDLEPGFDFLERQCRYLGLELTSTDRDEHITAQQISKVPTVKFGQKLKALNYSIVPDQAFFSLSARSNRGRSHFREVNYMFGSSLYIFWGIIMAGGAVLNLASFLAGATSKQPAQLTKNLMPAAVRSYWVMPSSFRVGKLPKFPGLVATTLICYAILNIILCAVEYRPSFVSDSILFKPLAVQTSGMVARRFATLGLANLPIIWLFSMRNNPLIYITGWTFPVFNQFHRWIARIAVLELIAHGITFTKFEFIKGGATRYYTPFHTELYWRAGVSAVVVLSFAVLFAVPYARRKAYDIFLATHILIIVAALVLVWYHVSDFSGEFEGFVWACVAIWATERLVRVVRLLATAAMGRYGVADVRFDDTSNSLRVDTSRLFSKVKPQPGTHYFVYTPWSLFFWQSHPFTLVGYDTKPQSAVTYPEDKRETMFNISDANISDTSERSHSETGFLITPQYGFTRRLAKQVLRNNGSCKVTLLLEGPYGQAPPVERYEEVLMIVGGSGISVGVSSAYRALRSSNVTSVRLIWSMRRVGTLRSVRDEELQALLRDPRFKLEAHVTQEEGDPEKDSGLAVASYSRPDIYQVLDSMSHAKVSGKIAIVACGPDSMLQDTRLGVAKAIREGNSSFELFVESFTW